MKWWLATDILIYCKLNTVFLAVVIGNAVSAILISQIDFLCWLSFYKTNKTSMYVHLIGSVWPIHANVVLVCVISAYISGTFYGAFWTTDQLVDGSYPRPSCVAHDPVATGEGSWDARRRCRPFPKWMEKFWKIFHGAPTVLHKCASFRETREKPLKCQC